MRAIDADAYLESVKPRGISDELWKESNTYKSVASMPTIELEKPQRTGRWLPDNNSVYEMRFVCSECKESQVVPTIGFTKYKPIWDFCPNCGADMTEGEE